MTGKALILMIPTTILAILILSVGEPVLADGAAVVPVATAGVAEKADADKVKKPEKAVEPTTIEADSGEYDQKAQKALLTGNVHIIHLGMELWSDRVDIIFRKDSELQSLVATGNVVIKRVEGTATCGRAEYDAGTSALVLTEKPVLKQDTGSVVEAPEITYNRESGRFSWSGGGRIHYVQPGEDDAASKAFRKRMNKKAPEGE